MKRLLKLRRILKRKKPDFLRQEWFRFPRLGKKWRRPKGRHSKLRKHVKNKGYLPKPGYGSPVSVRGLHPSGLEEVRVFNPQEVKNLNPKTQAVRIASSVGMKKRIEIMKIANELGIRVLNPVKLENKGE